MLTLRVPRQRDPPHLLRRLGLHPHPEPRLSRRGCRLCRRRVQEEMMGAMKTPVRRRFSPLLAVRQQGEMNQALVRRNDVSWCDEV